MSDTEWVAHGKLTIGDPGAHFRDGVLVESDTGRRWHLSASAGKLLRRLTDSEVSFGSLTEAEQRFVQHSLVPTGVGALVSPTLPLLPPPPPNSGLLRIPLFTWSAREGHPLAFTQMRMFPAVFWAALTAAVLAVAAYSVLVDRHPLPAGAHEPILLSVLIAMTIFAHELGHLALARLHGADAREIGVSVYGVFPVAYVDLSPCWRLPRPARAQVAMAGVGVQAISALVAAFAALLMGYGATADHLLAVTAAGIALSMNPFLKFDGYWLLGDLTGIPNLQTTAIAALRRAWTGRRRSNPALAAGTRRDRWLPLYAAGIFAWWLAILFFAATRVPSLVATWSQLLQGDSRLSARGLIGLCLGTAVLLALTMSGWRFLRAATLSR